MKLIILGSCCSTHYPRQGCDCPSCQDPTFQRRKHSSLMLKDIMLDCGRDWINIPSHIKNIALTHHHPDHAFGIKNHIQKDITFYMTKDIMQFLIGAKIISEKDRQKIRIVKYFETVYISDIKFKFFPIEHTTVVPATCMKIDDKIIYCPDMRNIYKKSLVFSGVKFYIGDGSSIKRDITYGSKSLGHMSIPNQMDMCKHFGIQKVYFTHVGHIKMSHAQINEFVKQLNKERYHFKDVRVVREGDVITV